MLDKSILENDLNNHVSYEKFFTAFGYKPKENVYIRLFDDSKTNKNDHGTQKKSTPKDFYYFADGYLKEENAKRRGVHFVVNGGGNTDTDVLKSGCCKAQFMEIDDCPFDEQIERLNAFPLEPSIIIKTKKSLHCYWLLEEGKIKFFREVQAQFAKHFGSDASIQNESRVMRLYGFNHCKQEPPVMVKLIKFTPDLKYTQEQLAKTLPQLTGDELAKVYKKLGKKTNNSTANNANKTTKNEYYNVSEGGRTAALISYIGHLKNTGISTNEIMALVRNANNTYTPPLSEDELTAEVFPSIDRFDGSTKEPIIDGQINKAYFHHFDAKGAPKKPFDSRIRDYLPQIYNIIIFSGIPWIYTNGHWVMDATTTKLRYLIEQFLYDDFKTEIYIHRIYDLIMHTAKLEKSWKDVNKHPKTWVNFKDCYVDLMDLSEHEHKADYLTLNQINMTWKEVKAAAPGKQTDAFIEFAIPDSDDREMLLEYFGYALTTDISQQKALVLYGNGSTGKSTILNLERSILGTDNVSSVALQEIGTRFKASRLVGMLANISADLPSSSLKDASTFKMITSGEDAIDTERKGKDGFSFVNYAKMLFSTNGLPIIEGERSTGAFRRLLLIAFQQVPTAKDPLLSSKLSKELPYFCKMVIHAANRMYKRGYLLESENCQKSISQLRKDSDVTQAWLDDCTKQGREYKANRQDAYNSFERYCISEKRRVLSPNSFYAALRAKGLTEYRTNTGRGFKGIFVNLG